MIKNTVRIQSFLATHRWKFKACPVDILEDIGHDQAHNVRYEAHMAWYIHAAEMLILHWVFLKSEIANKIYI